MDKTALIKAEIERLLKVNTPYESEGYRFGLLDIRSFIDTLSEEPDKSLEEAAVAFVWDIMENDYYGPSELSKRLRPTSKLDDFYGALAEIFIAGAKWEAGQLLKSSPLPEDTVLFQKGVEEGKRLMLEGAVEGEVESTTLGIIYLRKNLDEGYSTGDKVRIIVCKNED